MTITAIDVAPSEAEDTVAISTGESSFSLFPQFPAEIRIKIWEAAIAPRIIKCKHSNNLNIFTGPSVTLPLFNVCQESRETAFFRGEYKLVSASPNMIYFSPIYDYLWFDAGWSSLIAQASTIHNPPSKSQEDFAQSVPDYMLKLRKIMVHPNWSDQRMKPTVQLTKFTFLKTILVAADERSIGVQSKVMLDTIYDIKMYYNIAKRDNPSIQIPQTAVGCLGWTGADGRRIYHSNEDNRQLVGIFENYSAMKDHQQMLREEEWRFTRDRFTNPQAKFIAKLERARELSKKIQKSKGSSEMSLHPRHSSVEESPRLITEPPEDELPAYREAASSNVSQFFRGWT
ncbi:hypothetical protein BJ875DRAFT_176969 [Amylocarpus encephaloides]|uniref:2EXR domain-containing protein n=1 Tax=Amylocarpus encephaloides TaxID=45428 RepID=A0A9P8C247_9HELO|nr:hypothetical protein BJ875DRAFT_176969 [Amylocarpus encephaloides]